MKMCPRILTKGGLKEDSLEKEFLSELLFIGRKKTQWIGMAGTGELMPENSAEKS